MSSTHIRTLQDQIDALITSYHLDQKLQQAQQAPTLPAPTSAAPPAPIATTAIPRIADHGPRADDRQVGGTHYKDMVVSPWEVVDSWPLEQRIGAYRAGALKYLMRMGTKDQAPQEIAKGIHYLEKLLDTLQEQKSVK